MSETYWEQRYASVERLWSGEPNEILARAAPAWSPGRSLDLACGEGDDVLHLASLGWQATGVDLSPTAVARLREGARRRGLADRVEGQALDLVHDDLPAGPFDLVTSFYLHGSWDAESFELAQVLARAAGRVAPAGRLMAVVHCVNPPWHTHRARTYRPAELARAVLDLVARPQDWQVEADYEDWHEARGPQGQVGRRSDAVVILRRVPGAQAVGDAGDADRR